MIVGVLTIFIGALNSAAGIQELVIQGIGRNQLVPLAGWPITLLGVVWPLFLMLHVRGARSVAQPVR